MMTAWDDGTARRPRGLGMAAVVLAMMVFAASCGSDDTAEDGADRSPSTSTSTSTTTTGSPTSTTAAVVADTAEFVWTEVVAEAPWSKRAGLRVVELDGRFLLLGGRTPNESTIPGDSAIWSDVWASDDRGSTWELLLDSGGDHWEPRAYFQAVEKDGAVYVLGGQDYGLDPNPFCALLESGLEPPPGLGIDPDAPCPEFVPTSQFFNDVWRSADGVEWEEMTDAAPWAGRAGLSAAVLGEHLYVLGGSQNDDQSIIGPGGPERIYYNDVWRSPDGAEWELMTDDAPWEPRAGAAVVVLDDHLYVLGGEDGFTCEPLPNCEPPYYNDVWRTADGVEWELVVAEAGWSPRPGHVCEVTGVDDARRIVCFGGFGLVENPTDVWVSPDGAEWIELAGSPWGVTDQAAAKYDFDSLVATDAAGIDVIYTFGGDRETFDFSDPENYLRVDNDVWSFGPG